MDDDMKAVNLSIEPKLENKINFYYSPYNTSKQRNFYMKFGENAAKWENPTEGKIHFL